MSPWSSVRGAGRRPHRGVEIRVGGQNRLLGDVHLRNSVTAGSTHDVRLVCRVAEEVGDVGAGDDEVVVVLEVHDQPLAVVIAHSRRRGHTETLAHRIDHRDQSDVFGVHDERRAQIAEVASVGAIPGEVGDERGHDSALERRDVVVVEHGFGQDLLRLRRRGVLDPTDRREERDQVGQERTTDDDSADDKCVVHGIPLLVGALNKELCILLLAQDEQQEHILVYALIAQLVVVCLSKCFGARLRLDKTYLLYHNICKISRFYYCLDTAPRFAPSSANACPPKSAIPLVWGL